MREACRDGLCAGAVNGGGGAGMSRPVRHRLLPAFVSEAAACEGTDRGGRDGRPVLAEACNHGWLESEERGWLRDPALAGGGPLYDTGSHRIDAFNFLFGRPARATGLLSNVVHQLGVEDSATVLVDYENGARGVVDVRWNSRVVRDEFRVIGTEGEMELTPLNGPELRYGGKVETLPPHANLHYPLMENFVAAVRDGSPVVCPGAEAVWVDWVTERVKRGG